MNRKLTEDLHQHFAQKENPNYEESLFLRQLTEEIDDFPALSISRDDLAQVGFDGEAVDDCDMTELAKKVGESYTEVLYWESLKILAADMGIPILRNSFCPMCGCDVIHYDAGDSSYMCDGGHSWSDKLYVLAKYPDSTMEFEEKNIGYPCFNCEDNGARYVKEFDYILEFKKEPDENRYFLPVQWPRSQEYFELQYEKKSRYELCEPIEHGKAFDDFGSQAIWVPLCFIEKKCPKKIYKTSLKVGIDKYDNQN